MIHRHLIATAKERPSQVALYDMATEKSYTYKQLITFATVLAGEFSTIPSHYVGVMMPTTFAAMAVQLGALMAGKIPVMINFSTGIEQNIAYARRKCGFTTVVTVRKLYDTETDHHLFYLEEWGASLSSLEKLTLLLRGNMVSLLQKSKEKMDDTAVLLFTSGSEKEPKVVELSHANILSNIEGIIDRFQFTADDRLAQILPLFHVFGYTVNFVLPLYLGMSSVASPSPLEYQKIVEMIRANKITAFAGTPVFLQGYLKKSVKGDFSSVRLVVSGADKLPPSLADGYRSLHGIEIMEGYGTTETSPVISANSKLMHRTGSIGKPLCNVAVKIVSLDTGEPVPTGEQGKILVKGALVMKGYLGDMEETSLRMRNGWYDTGDMGHLDAEGFLWHDGRLKRFAKIGGEMVSLVHVESVLQALVGDGVQCCVVELPDPIKGGQIVAAVAEGVKLQEVKKRIKEFLPPIAQPKQYVTFASLPLMGTGKINFREVERLCLAKREK